jgi:hypothetical protein
MFLPIPDDVIEALARRVAEIVLAEMAGDMRPVSESLAPCQGGRRVPRPHEKRSLQASP